MISQTSGPGKFARDSTKRRKAKSQMMGPLLPSLIVAVVQASAGTEETRSSTRTGRSVALRKCKRMGWRPRPFHSGRYTSGRDCQIKVEHLISVKYHLFSAATPSRKAGESPYNSSAATH